MGTGLGRPGGEGGLTWHQGTARVGAGGSGVHGGARFLAKYGASVRGGVIVIVIHFVMRVWRGNAGGKKGELRRRS